MSKSPGKKKWCHCAQGMGHKHLHIGGNIFTDAGNWLKGAASTVGNAVVKGSKAALGAAVKEISKHKPSEIAGLIGDLGIPGVSTVANGAKRGLQLVGKGRKRKAVRGGGFWDHFHKIGWDGKRVDGGARGNPDGKRIAQPKGVGFNTTTLGSTGGGAVRNVTHAAGGAIRA